jgi:hypothetical protein
MLLRSIAPQLWCAEGEVRFFGQQLPLRTVVARLGDGSLWVHSPLAWDPALGAELGQLGAVRHLVAPNKYHHLWLAQWMEQFPQAATYAAPGLARKRPDLKLAHELGPQAPAQWAGEFEQCVFRGLPVLNEVVFFHRASRTLLVTDLVFHIHTAENRTAQCVLWLDDIWKRFGPSRLLRWAMRPRRVPARADLERMLTWDFERVVMGHGEILESGGREALRRAFAFLLKGPG